VKIARIAGLCLSVLLIGSATASDATCGKFKIMSYNIRHGQRMDGTLDLSAAGKVIAAEHPRFVGLQEVDVNTERIGGKNNLDAISAETGLTATFAKAIPLTGGAYGNAVLSQERPISVRRIPLPGGEPRVLLLCEFGDCWFGTTHLAVDSAKARTESVGLIRRAVSECAPKPVFLTGDWNSEPGSEVLKGMCGFMTILSPTDRNTFHGGRPVVTPADRDFCIDYIAVDSSTAAAWQTSDARVIEDRQTSDHFPLVLTVNPKGR